MSQATDQYKAAILRLDEARERIKALEAENERVRTQMEAQKDMWLSWEAKRSSLEKDAAQWHEFCKGKTLTVKMKKSIVVFGPNPESDYAKALGEAVDKAMHANTEGEQR